MNNVVNIKHILEFVADCYSDVDVINTFTVENFREMSGEGHRLLFIKLMVKDNDAISYYLKKIRNLGIKPRNEVYGITFFVITAKDC